MGRATGKSAHQRNRGNRGHRKRGGGPPQLGFRAGHLPKPRRRTSLRPRMHRSIHMANQATSYIASPTPNAATVPTDLLGSPVWAIARLLGGLHLPGRCQRHTSTRSSASARTARPSCPFQANLGFRPGKSQVPIKNPSGGECRTARVVAGLDRILSRAGAFLDVHREESTWGRTTAFAAR